MVPQPTEQLQGHLHHQLPHGEPELVPELGQELLLPHAGARVRVALVTRKAEPHSARGPVRLPVPLLLAPVGTIVRVWFEGNRRVLI